MRKHNNLVDWNNKVYFIAWALLFGTNKLSLSKVARNIVPINVCGSFAVEYQTVFAAAIKIE